MDTVNFEEQILQISARFFRPNDDYCVYYILQIFFATLAGLKIGEYHSDTVFPCFSWGTFSHVKSLCQKRVRLRWICIPSRGGQKYSPIRFGISSCKRCATWLICRLSLIIYKKKKCMKKHSLRSLQLGQNPRKIKKSKTMYTKTIINQLFLPSIVC